MHELKKDNKRWFQWVIIGIIPVIYVILGSYFRNLLGNLSLRSCDPEYIYFMSGVTMADGVLQVGHIDNPGTPLQLLMAIVFRLLHLLRGAPAPFLEDVFTHPDLYLAVTNLCITFFTSALLYYIGKRVLRTTRNWLYALLVQTAPFMPVIWYDLIGRVAPELIMPFPVILLMALVLDFYFSDTVEFGTGRIVSLSAISALGLSVKLSFIGIWLIPLFIIPRWRSKLIFIVLSILLFLLLAFPVTLQLDVFWSWIKNLFLHSGTYGSGEANFMDIQSAIHNVQELVHYEKGFFIVIMALITSLTSYAIIHKKAADRKTVITALALIFTVAVQVILVGKHYAHRYFIPVLLLTPLMIILTAEILKKIQNRYRISLFTSLLVVFYLIWFSSNNMKWLPIKTAALGEDIGRRLPTWHFAEGLEKDRNLIITSQNYGSPFIEYTMFYSLAWSSNDKKEDYAKILSSLYPNSFSYFTWNDELKYWKEKPTIQKLIDSGKKTYLYLERNEELLYQKTMDKIQSLDTCTYNIEHLLLYENPATNEAVYELYFDSKPEVDHMTDD